jgi:hypothetical protein
MRFGLTTSTRVDFGSAAAVDNLTAMTIVLLMRNYQAITSGRAIVSKGTTTSNWSLRTSGSNLRFLWNRATTDLDYITSDTPAPTNDTGRWKWVAVTVDQAGSAGSLVAVYHGRLGQPGQPPRLTTSTFGTNTDGADAYDDDNASTIRLCGDQGGTNSAQADVAFCALFGTALSLQTIRKVMVNPLAYRASALVLAFPGQSGKTYVKNHAVGTFTTDGAITSAQPISGPQWAPWETPADDEPAAVAAAGGGDQGAGLFSNTLFDNVLVHPRLIV